MKLHARRATIGDLRHVKTDVFGIPGAFSFGEMTTRRLAPLRELSDRFLLAALQVRRACGAAESLDNCNLLLRGVARFCCGESPTTHA